jgi:alkylation response protein AidB-like acyl-CoA dehydrogenase
MDFAFSSEQEEFRETLSRFFEEQAPISEAFRLMETPEGYDPVLWKQMGEELGLQGVHVPEAYGGQGFGFLELGLVVEEMGRALLCSPFFSSACLATPAILNAGTEEQKQRWLPGLASGETIGTLALLDDGDEWSPEAVTLEATHEGDSLVLNGRKRLVTDGAQASLFVVAAREPGTSGRDGITLAVVEAATPGVSVTPLETLDMTRKLADIAFDGVRAQPLGGVGEAGDVLGKTLDQARVCLALENTAGAERCLHDAVTYAKQRIQFGRAIGSFQAIKHTLAEVLLEVESGKSAAYWASWVASEDREELPLAAAVAKSFCDDAYVKASEDNMHVHGGIGVTWEASPHLFAKRAKANETLLGHPAWQRRRIAEIQGF